MTRERKKSIIKVIGKERLKERVGKGKDIQVRTKKVIWMGNDDVGFGNSGVKFWKKKLKVYINYRDLKLAQK